MSERQPPYPGLDDISEVPSSTTAWNVYGRGVESVGRGGLPEEVPVGVPGPDQLLVRVDAVGLCFSDVKLIRQGGDHPKLYGRDLAKEPTRLGHEAAVTGFATRKDHAERFPSGDPLPLPPDNCVGGRN